MIVRSSAIIIWVVDTTASAHRRWSSPRAGAAAAGVTAEVGINTSGSVSATCDCLRVSIEVAAVAR
jgi:hypothetical protein